MLFIVESSARTKTDTHAYKYKSIAAFQKRVLLKACDVFHWNAWFLFVITFYFLFIQFSENLQTMNKKNIQKFRNWNAQSREWSRKKNSKIFTFQIQIESWRYCTFKFTSKYLFFFSSPKRIAMNGRIIEWTKKLHSAF